MIKLNYYEKKYDKIIEGFSRRKRRRKRRKKKEKANELGISVKDYSQEVKDVKTELKDVKAGLKDAPKEIPKNKKKKKIIYYWPDFKYPLSDESIVQMNKNVSDEIITDINYLYKKKNKNNFCIKLDKCKKTEIKNDFLKKKLLKTEIKLGYLKDFNDKKINEIDNINKEIKKKFINRGILVLILIIFVGIILFGRYYVSVLQKIRKFS